VTQSFAERIRSEIADKQINAELRARIDEWLKVDKEFNVWFLVTTKRALDDEELLELLDGYRESQEIVEDAWERYEEKKDETMLMESITQSIHRMKLLQSRT
jgi:hypothetical protein